MLIMMNSWIMHFFNCFRYSLIIDFTCRLVSSRRKFFDLISQNKTNHFLQNYTKNIVTNFFLFLYHRFYSLCHDRLFKVLALTFSVSTARRIKILVFNWFINNFMSIPGYIFWWVNLASQFFPLFLFSEIAPNYSFYFLAWEFLFVIPPPFLFQALFALKWISKDPSTS